MYLDILESKRIIKNVSTFVVLKNLSVYTRLTRNHITFLGYFSQIVLKVMRLLVQIVFASKKVKNKLRPINPLLYKRFLDDSINRRELTTRRVIEQLPPENQVHHRNNYLRE